MADDPARDPEEPRTNGPRAIEIGQPPVNHQKRLLHRILRLCGPAAETKSASPHEVKMSPIHLGQRQRPYGVGIGYVGGVHGPRRRLAAEPFDCCVGGETRPAKHGPWWRSDFRAPKRPSETGNGADTAFSANRASAFAACDPREAPIDRTQPTSSDPPGASWDYPCEATDAASSTSSRLRCGRLRTQCCPMGWW